MLSGSVIFWKGGLLVHPISQQTGSLLTHVAIVFDDIVYEATPPRVRKLGLNEYIKHLEHLKTLGFWRRRNFSWFTMSPIVAYNPSELDAMRQYAESQLGRPYRLRGWWSNDQRGIFCSQYVGNVIEKSGRIVSANNRESPGSLHQKLRSLYG
jgi:hypothetical protein